MALPETNREIYTRNPLAEVTAQLRFDPILRIEAEPPAGFQDAIRQRYPQYRRMVGAGQLPADMPPPVRNLIEGMGAAAGGVQHFFGTQDQRAGVPVSQVVLSSEALTFKTIAYTRWDEFSEQLNRLRAVLEEIYRPVSYTRLGLRYVDIIRRSILALNGVGWSDLLNPFVGGELSSPELGEAIDSAQRQLHCKLEGDNCFLTLKTGIVLAAGATPGTAKEKCFLIDSDFHTHTQTEMGNVTGTLDRFNRASGNLFRWAIRPRLREALQPQPL
jgi:uncharacterized protein (TIGR04255 family)